MRDEIQTRYDPLLLWNAALSALADGIALPRRGQVRGHEAQGAAPADLPAFDLSTDAGPVHVQFLRLPLGALTQSALDVAALARLPASLSEAILALATETLLREAGEGVRRRVLSVKRSEGVGTARGLRLEVVLEGVWSEPVEVAVTAERAVLSALMLEALPRSTGSLPQALATRMELPCSLRIAGRTLPLARLRQLGVGDLILAGGAGLILSTPHARLGLQNDGTNWTIGSVDMNDDLPSEALQDAAPPAEAPLPDIGAVPVRLSFVLSDHVMTVAELQALTKGALLPLEVVPAEPGRPVKLLANGRPIGDGHVVDVDGQPAIRIARLFGN